jgi:hypothetical protein
MPNTALQNAETLREQREKTQRPRRGNPENIYFVFRVDNIFGVCYKGTTWSEF